MQIEFDVLRRATPIWNNVPFRIQIPFTVICGSTIKLGWSEGFHLFLLGPFFGLFL
jgi:hypothetical protein